MQSDIGYSIEVDVGQPTCANSSITETLGSSAKVKSLARW